MHLNKNHTISRRALAILLTLTLCLGMIPTAFAGQQNSYHDPAEHWMQASNRTNELDVNSVVTRETFKCGECGKVTSFEVFRVPEYTRNGQTALSRNVKYSDGTMMDGVGKGDCMDGVPGKDAYYTGYHYTKAVCETCGGINTNEPKSDYGYLKNVYWLFDCAAEFTQKLEETVTYEYTDDTYHTVTTKGGTYCAFCYGTNHTVNRTLERHSMETEVLPQPANGRFATVEKCSLCDYASYDYTAAKAVIADYYGIVDGQPHTITVSDLSEAGVRTSIRLPNSRLLDYADQTTVTVQLVKDKSAVPGMSIAVTDKNDNYASGKTDQVGQLTVPTGSGKTNEDGKVTAGYEDADGDRWTLTIKVEHTDTGRPIPNAEVAIGKTGNITVKLPDGTDLDKNHRVTVTVTDHKKNPQENKNIIVKGDLSQTAKGKTDQDGKLTVPEIEERERHGAYILGYTDGTFGPSRSMTRAEAAAIFARLLAEKNGDTISTVANTRFTDIPAHAWYSGYAKYLNNNGVTYGKSKTIFAPDDAITRAEFTTLAVRFFDVYGDGDAEIMEQYKDFNDVSDGYWAAAYIKAAAKHGWINGYGDGSFRADDEINRAEVVTIVNRLLGREADEDYIADNLRKLNTFPDVSRKHWVYYAVMEAANAHTAVLGENESWSK